MKSPIEIMKSPILFLRTAFVLAALSTGIAAINSSSRLGSECDMGFGYSSRSCGLTLAYTFGSVSSTLFFISGATWKYGNSTN